MPSDFLPFPFVFSRPHLFSMEALVFKFKNVMIIAIYLMWMKCCESSFLRRGGGGGGELGSSLMTC